MASIVGSLARDSCAQVSRADGRALLDALDDAIRRLDNIAWLAALNLPNTEAPNDEAMMRLELILAVSRYRFEAT